MDHSNIPECALFWNTGTVIVRLKMEVTTSCCKGEVYPGSGCSKVVHRPSGCEQCTRTRLISQYSDCDSSVVERSRPYKASAARSRYVNVCAAVCLLLLVGGLSPRSSAAPHRNRANMERQRRAADEEHVLWANPCDYSDSQAVPSFSPTYVASIADRLVKATKFAMIKASELKENFTNLHSFDSFEALLKEWKGEDWLRKINANALPENKVYNQPLPDKDIEQIMTNINQHLPTMYKDLKTITAGLYNFSSKGLNGNVVADNDLKKKMNETMSNVRAVLCYFNQIMIARNLEIRPLLDKDIPETNDPSLGFLLYRDTINYLEYLEQVFTKLDEKETKV